MEKICMQSGEDRHKTPGDVDRASLNLVSEVSKFVKRIEVLENKIVELENKMLSMENMMSRFDDDTNSESPILLDNNYEEDSASDDFPEPSLVVKVKEKVVVPQKLSEESAVNKETLIQNPGFQIVSEVGAMSSLTPLMEYVGQNERAIVEKSKKLYRDYMGQKNMISKERYLNFEKEIDVLSRNIGDLNELVAACLTSSIKAAGSNYMGLMKELREICGFLKWELIFPKIGEIAFQKESDIISSSGNVVEEKMVVRNIQQLGVKNHKGVVIIKAKVVVAE
jgi:hypothetical protein